jgi:hypothetical protein
MNPCHSQGVAKGTPRRLPKPGRIELQSDLDFLDRVPFLRVSDGHAPDQAHGDFTTYNFAVGLPVVGISPALMRSLPFSTL